MNIIDTHAHVFPDKVAQKAAQGIADFYGLGLSFNGTVEQLKRSMLEGGVASTVICSVATTPHQVKAANDYAASIMGDGIYSMGTMHPDFPEPEEEIARMKSLGLLGMKLHPDFQEFKIDDEKLYPIYRAMGGYPLLIHVGDKRYEYSAPERMARVLDLFPDLVVIAAHLGGYSEWESAKSCLLGKNLYIDTSSALWAMRPDEAKEIIRMHGVDKVLFGTDYPLASHTVEIARVKKIGLTEEEERMIFHDNAAKLFRINSREDTRARRNPGWIK